MQISTLDEVSIARLYDTKSFSPETYERLLLDAPLFLTTKQNESGKLFTNKLGNNLVGQTSQGSFSKLHVLNWDKKPTKSVGEDCFGLTAVNITEETLFNYET